MNFFTGMSYLQNQIRYKNWVVIVKTVFLCNVSIHPNLCLKFHKVFKVTEYAIRRGNCDVSISLFSKLPILFTATSHRNNLISTLNLILKNNSYQWKSSMKYLFYLNRMHGVYEYLDFIRIGVRINTVSQISNIPFLPEGLGHVDGHRT